MKPASFSSKLFGSAPPPQSGEVHIETVGGDIEANGGVGPLRGKSISGDVSVSDRVQGQVNVTTISGDIKLANPDPNTTETASSMSGRIRGQKSAASCGPKFGGGPADPFRF